MSDSDDQRSHLVSSVAAHPLLAEFRRETRARLTKVEREISQTVNLLGRIENTLEDRDRRITVLEQLRMTGKAPNGEMAKGAVGHVASTLGITPGMLWISIVLCAILIGKPFIDFVKGVIPFGGVG